MKTSTVIILCLVGAAVVGLIAYLYISSSTAVKQQQIAAGTNATNKAAQTAQTQAAANTAQTVSNNNAATTATEIAAGVGVLGTLSNLFGGSSSTDGSSYDTSGLDTSGLDSSSLDSVDTSNIDTSSYA